MLRRRSFLCRSPFTEKPAEVGSRKWLIAELDKYTSIIVRRRDRRCVTCGSFRNLQCSHFYSRRYLATRFDLRNCNAMCGRCNRRHNDDPFPYLNYMNKHYGEEVVSGLHALRMSLWKVEDDELRELLEEYRRIAR